MIRSFAVSAPASLAIVGSRSIVIAAWRMTAPAGILPGHRATNGVRTPPSKVVPLLAQPQGLPAVIAVAQPRAVVRREDHQSVSIQIQPLQRVEDLADRPIDLLDHVSVQPRCVLPLNFSETNSGTCGIECGR